MEPKMTVNSSYSVNDMHPCYELENTSYVFTSNPSITCVLLYFFFGLLSVVTTCGNLLVIISILYFKQLHSGSNYLILSLAVADLLVGVLAFPLSMTVTVTTCWYQEDLLCKIHESIDVILSQASVLLLCCISIDRYYAICQPLTYKTKITNQVIGFMILISWGTAALITILVMSSGCDQGDCEDNSLIDAVISTTLACIFSFYIPVIIMLSLYLKIFIVAQRQANSIQNTICQSTKSRITVSKTERKATKTLAVVMGVFLLCWTPFFLFYMVQPLVNVENPIVVFETLNWLARFNSMFNPFIYAFFYSRFRSAFRMIISGKIFQGDFSNSQLDLL
ncbi:trace amine-associated receptor 1-like [Brachionichthys hirsutus]|uniref:trace amine-associated receptor 1-like n=1 Tax=Brachionichthys hirsutus TaxID=412623 RepID=UPI003604BFE8